MLDGARIFHVNLNCSDLDRSRRFWVDGLGFGEGARTTPPAPQDGVAFGLDTAWWDAWILTGRKGFDGGVLDVLEWRDPAPVGAPPTTYEETGFQRLGIGVPDLDAAMTSLRAAGGAVWSEPIVHSSELAPEVHLVHASDPDGIGLELFETPGASGPDLSFVSVVCADLERSVAWYEALGFRGVARFPSTGADGTPMRITGAYAFEEVMLAAPAGGRVSIMLSGFTTPAAQVAPPRPANALGIWRTALLVPDLDACVAALIGAGVALVSPVAAMAMGPGLPDLRFVCLRGPDAEVLELIESPT